MIFIVMSIKCPKTYFLFMKDLDTNLWSLLIDFLDAVTSIDLSLPTENFQKWVRQGGKFTLQIKTPDDRSQITT